MLLAVIDPSPPGPVYDLTIPFLLVIALIAVVWLIAWVRRRA